MDIICYHESCPDGFTAAYIAHKRYPEAKLMPMLHGRKFNLDDFRDKDVLMVDFSFRNIDGASNDDVYKIAKSLRILDHHKSEQAEVEGKPYGVFDQNRSGAGLAFDYLFGKDSPESQDYISKAFPPTRPWFVNYVEDRDLWRHSLPKSREVNAFIMTFPYTMDGWKDMARYSVEEAIQAGDHVKLQVDHYVREIVKHAQPGQLGGHSVLIVNAPYLNVSEVGENLAQNANIGMAWFERKDGMIQFSLRSKTGSNIDVSLIAKRYQGGGHKHAAGIQLSIHDGRELIDDIIMRGEIPLDK